MPQHHLLSLQLDSLRELAEQPLKLSDYQLNVILARARIKQQSKLDYHPDFTNEEAIRKSIRNLALIDGALEFITDLIEEQNQPTNEED